MMVVSQIHGVTMQLCLSIVIVMRLSELRDCFFRMEKENSKPDLHTYNMFPKMLISFGTFYRVEEVWNSMPFISFCPSVSTYSVMMCEFLMKKGKLHKACKYFEIIISKGFPPYSSIIEVLRNLACKMGNARSHIG